MVVRVSRGVDHAAVVDQVARACEVTGGYLMMTAISAAIAILGLLLSSPAVIIGAMLLSPLMGPIVLLGFSFGRVDWASTRKALASLGAGFGIALAVSIVLTLLSPLKEPTAEILARSRPTLFDLLVAIFSGVAGGYAVVRNAGPTVIGVAIATALMPPLPVVGFGVGTRAWPIAGGALLLFFTNLIAIALVAAASGFRPRVQLRHGGWIPRLAVVAILAALCVPLTLSLGAIALQARATALARREVARLFGPKARIASLSVETSRHEVHVAALVATPRYVDHARQDLARSLQSGVHTPVEVALDQVVLADPSKLAPVAAPTPAQDAAAPPDPAVSAAADLRRAVPFAGTTIAYDPASGAGLIRLSPASGLDLAGARALETGLRVRPEEKGASVIPPVQPLPPVALSISQGAVRLGPTDLQAWAMDRWAASSVEARLCRGVHGPRTAVSATAEALQGAFAPRPLRLSTDAGACAAAPAARAPFVLVAPGAVALPPSSPLQNGGSLR